MASIFDKFPFSNYEGLNLDWVLQNLKTLFSEGEALYQDLREWKEDTTEDVQTWITETNAALATWKTQTETDFSTQITTELGTARQELLDTVTAGLLAIEGTAYGTQNGVPVEEGSPYYHNNCTWYKEQAAASAFESRAWANGANSSPLYVNNNSKYFRERSEAWAVGQINGTNVPDTDDAYENNAKYYANQIGAAAAQIATNTGDINDLKSITNNLENTILRTPIVLTASGMQTGRWMENGTYDTWNKSQCSTGYILTAVEELLLKASTSTQYRYIQLVEFDESNTVISIHGGYNPNASIPTTKTVIVTVPKGHKIKINIGYWSDSDAATYITDEYLAANYTIEYGYIPSVDTSLAIAGDAADAKETGDTIKRITPEPYKLSIQWEQGAYSSTTGGAQSGNTRVRTINYVPFHNYLKIEVPENYKLYWYRYSGWTYTTFTGHSPGWLTGTVIIYDDNAHYKLAFAKTDDSNISPTQVPDMAVWAGIPWNYLETGAYTTTLAKSILTCYNSLYVPEGEYTLTTGLELSDNQTIYGNGYNSILYWAESNNSLSAITCGSGNCIRDVQIKGRETDYVLENPQPGQDAVPSTQGNRNGIVITNGKSKGIIDNVLIHGFNGYALYADNNGTSSAQGFVVTDSYFIKNHGGIYLRKSEFYKISNCDCTGNYIGISLGGGNNTLATCNISSNHYGIYMNNADGLSTNNTHGSVVGCIIQHSRICAVYINNMASGEIFSACNIDPNGTDGYAVQAVSANRIIFTGCNFMEYSAISITGGGLIMFNGCNMRDYTSSHYTSNSNKVKFINCYNNSGDVVDPTQT